MSDFHVSLHHEVISYSRLDAYWVKLGLNHGSYETRNFKNMNRRATGNRPDQIESRVGLRVGS